MLILHVGSDLVKVRLQTQPSDRTPMFHGALDCVRKTYRKEGAKGLFRVRAYAPRGRRRLTVTGRA